VYEGYDSTQFTFKATLLPGPGTFAIGPALGSAHPKTYSGSYFVRHSFEHRFSYNLFEEYNTHLGLGAQVIQQACSTRPDKEACVSEFITELSKGPYTWELISPDYSAFSEYLNDRLQACAVSEGECSCAIDAGNLYDSDETVSIGKELFVASGAGTSATSYVPSLQACVITSEGTLVRTPLLLVKPSKEIFSAGSSTITYSPTRSRDEAVDVPNPIRFAKVNNELCIDLRDQPVLEECIVPPVYVFKVTDTDYLFARFDSSVGTFIQEHPVVQFALPIYQ
ncbi:hypothetical protein COY95_00455, partial [Candidatus Woesearchaeota archaeon CG_4_10_14_0_8_um_filter_47_5]